MREARSIVDPNRHPTAQITAAWLAKFETSPAKRGCR
jgi:hypothetical protein